MSGRRTWSMVPVMVACCLARPAWGFDPLLAGRSVPPTASAGLIPGDAPCSFGPVSQPLLLAEAVERGVCHNPKTREAWADVKARAAAVGVARAAYLPTVSGSWQGVRDDSVTDVSGHPQLSSHSAATVRSESVTLNWVLFDFGGRSAALQNASSLLAAARATQDAALQDEFATVAKDWYAVQAAQGALDAARDIEGMTRDTMVAAQARVDHGAAPVTDALQAQTQHDDAVYNLTKAEGDAQTALGRLASDMGLAPDTALAVPAATDVQPPDRSYGDSVAQLIDVVTRTHPGILAAQGQLDAANAKVAQTRAEGLPSVSLVAKYSHNNQPASLGLGIPTYPATGHDAYIGVQVTIPFFEGFGRHYQVRQAEAEAGRQQAVMDETVERVQLDVWTSWQTLRTATQNATHTEAALKNARLAFEAAGQRYEHGVGSILELLNTQAALATARGKRIEALTDWSYARLDLAAKLGRLDMGSASGSTMGLK